MSIYDHTTLIAKAKEIGLHAIRCNLTGKIIAELSDESLTAAIGMEVYDNPLASDESIIDSLQVRWLIQSTRPAPHLVGHKTQNGFMYLRQFHKQDLFAILASRLIFESIWIKKQEPQGYTVARARMQWLIELDSHDLTVKPDFEKILNALIRLDAIHNIRHAVYDVKIADLFRNLRGSQFDYDTLAIFVEMVENSGFIALSKMKNAPNGNTQSVNVALSQAGMTPDQIINENERSFKVVEMRRAAIQAVNGKGQANAGNAKVNHGVKAVFSLVDLGVALKPELAAKYAADLESRKPKKPDSSGKPAAVKKAISRFGSIDIDF